MTKFQASCIVATAIIREEERSLNGSKEIIATAAPLHQINCTGNPTICNNVCDEPQGSIAYSSTFCDHISGSCVCDCRDVRHMRMYLNNRCVQFRF